MNKTINKEMSSKATPEQIKRHNDIGKRLHLNLINAEHNVCIENMHKGFQFCHDIVNNEIALYDHYKNSKTLKYFSGMEKWNLLLEVVRCSSTGEIVYKEKLAKKLRCSHKTLTKYINEALEGGLFIMLNPISGVIKDKRIVNIRPSEDLIIDFVNYSVQNVVKTLNFVKNHCKIELDFKIN